MTTSCSATSSGATPCGRGCGRRDLVAGVFQQNPAVVGTEARVAEAVAGGPAERTDQPQRHPSAVCLLGRPADGLQRRFGSVDTDHDRPVCLRRVHRRSPLRIAGFRNARGRWIYSSTGGCRARGDDAAQDRPQAPTRQRSLVGRGLVGCDPEGWIARVDQCSRRLEPSVRGSGEGARGPDRSRRAEECQCRTDRGCEIRRTFRPGPKRPSPQPSTVGCTRFTGRLGT